MSEENRLRTEKVGKLLLAMALPAICAQVITLLYNMVDRVFIGRMADGTIAMAGVGICAPIVMVVAGFTGLFGRGGAPLAAISMGRGDEREAERYLGTSFVALVVSSALLTAAMLLWCDPLLLLFGASENTLPYAREYLTIYSLGTLFVQITIGMNFYITTQGFARFAMVTTMLGGVLNIALDPLFIFTLNMGVSGAALATVLSQLASCVWVLRFLTGRKTLLRLTRRTLRFSPAALRRIAALGAAPFFMSASEGVLHICFNRQALRYGGDIAVSAMTILFTMFQFLHLPLEGIAAGSQPILSYNYGAKAYDRVRETIRIAMRAALVIDFLGTALMLAFPQVFIRIFSDDAALITLGSRMLRLYVAGMFIMGVNSTLQQTYTSLGDGARSLLFAFFRKVVLLIPLLYALPLVTPWGLMAVVLAEPVSDVVTTVTNYVTFRFGYVKRKLPEG